MQKIVILYLRLMLIAGSQLLAYLTLFSLRWQIRELSKLSICSMQRMYVTETQKFTAAMEPAFAVIAN
ncbi:hypothetical protein ACJJJB_08070 [Microbulbifer sp. ANSA001]|uniref:hypothetical protein n=1 Tax=Microbulbifer sp. ANSA001 TaxID=3243358 RepID=UPI0040436A08